MAGPHPLKLSVFVRIEAAEPCGRSSTVEHCLAEAKMGIQISPPAPKFGLRQCRRGDGGSDGQGAQDVFAECRSSQGVRETGEEVCGTLS